MQGEPLSILVDTNVWLDYYLGFREGHERAKQMLNLANGLGASLLYAITSSKDVFYLISGDCKHAYRNAHGGKITEEASAAAREVAWSCLKSMNDWATAVGCDQSDTWLAQTQRALHDDYEDNLVIAAALRARPTLLVTNNEQLLRHSPVAALDTRDAIAYLESRR